MEGNYSKIRRNKIWEVIQYKGLILHVDKVLAKKRGNILSLFVVFALFTYRLFILYVGCMQFSFSFAISIKINQV